LPDRIYRIQELPEECGTPRHRVASPDSGPMTVTFHGHWKLIHPRPFFV